MKNCILITNVDSLLGYALAYQFLKDWNRQALSTAEFRLLCRERQGLKDLELLGAKIYEIESYENEKKMMELMDGVGYVMFLPENSSRRVEEGESVLKCAKKQGVDYVTMFSYLGVDYAKEASQGLKHMNQYYRLEKQLEKLFGHDSYCVIRSGCWHQFFFYFGPMIEDENKITLPTSSSNKTKFTSIDLNDLVNATYHLSRDSSDTTNVQVHQLAQWYIANLRKKNKTLFEFTPSHSIALKDLVKAASKGLELEQEITYEQISPKRLYDYLYRIHNDNRFRERPDRSHSTFPLGQYLNGNVIEGILEYWEMVQKGHADYITDDLQEALHHQSPVSVDQFFSHNRDQFRRLR